MQGGQGARGDDLRPVRPADLPAHGRRHRRDGNADLQGLGSGSRAGRGSDEPPETTESQSEERRWTRPERTVTETTHEDAGDRLRRKPAGGQPAAWEMIESRPVHAAPHPRQLPRPGTRLNVRHAVRFGRPDTIAERERAMDLTVVKNATCTFCGCVCDDIELHADGVRIVETKRACVLGRIVVQEPHRRAALPRRADRRQAGHGR